jgi:hypothetical protein
MDINRGGRHAMNGALSQSNYVRGGISPLHSTIKDKKNGENIENGDSDTDVVAMPADNDADNLDFESERGDP